MNSFIEYYNSEIKKAGGTMKYIFLKAEEKKYLLKRIKKYAKNRRVIEAGCGSASNSIYLANQGYHVTCIDKNRKIINFAKKNALVFPRKPKFIQIDIANMLKIGRTFDVSFSHGVLEHYSDDEAVKLINYQLSIAKYVIISVPSSFFKKSQAINGDERFLGKKHWRRIIKKTNGILVDSFGYFYDSDEIYLRLLKMASKITLNKLPFKKPYLGFVIRRK